MTDYASDPDAGDGVSDTAPPRLRRPRRRKAAACPDVRELARRQTEAAIDALAETLISPKAPPAAKVSAAIALLDRGWGKVTQNVSFDAGRAVAEFLATVGMGAVPPGDPGTAQPADDDGDPGGEGDA